QHSGAAPKSRGRSLFVAGKTKLSHQGGRCRIGPKIGALQLMAGGKKMPQKLGEGDMNSTGTSAPSCDICGGRTTRTSTLLCVLGFSTVSLVPSAKGSETISIAPPALTVWVWPSRAGVLPST